jgi:hypothetical protein
VTVTQNYALALNGHVSDYSYYCQDADPSRENDLYTTANCQEVRAGGRAASDCVLEPPGTWIHMLSVTEPRHEGPGWCYKPGFLGPCALA